MTTDARSHVLVSLEFLGCHRPSRVVTMSRVPCVGEFVALFGDDEDEEVWCVRSVYHDVQPTDVDAIVRLVTS